MNESIKSLKHLFEIGHCLYAVDVSGVFQKWTTTSIVGLLELLYLTVDHLRDSLYSAFLVDKLVHEGINEGSKLFYSQYKLLKD